MKVEALGVPGRLSPPVEAEVGVSDQIPRAFGVWDNFYRVGYVTCIFCFSTFSY